MGPWHADVPWPRGPEERDLARSPLGQVGSGTQMAQRLLLSEQCRIVASSQLLEREETGSNLLAGLVEHVVVAKPVQ